MVKFIGASNSTRATSALEAMPWYRGLLSTRFTCAYVACGPGFTNCRAPSRTRYRDVSEVLVGKSRELVSGRPSGVSKGELLQIRWRRGKGGVSIVLLLPDTALLASGCVPDISWHTIFKKVVSRGTHIRVRWFRMYKLKQLYLSLIHI